MLRPLIRRSLRSPKLRSRESGFTMALVALALTTIVIMAALSIDIGTFYQAKAEAQRAADAAALTAARMISISGITGDPTNSSTSWQPICGGASSAATLAAINEAEQNQISGAAVPSANVSVNYGVGSAGASSATCVGLGTGFGVNPVVTVTVTSATLPIFFARVFSLLPGAKTFANTTTSATATAEVFNSSNSGSVAAQMVPVQPRCVKPLIIPNIDPTSSTSAPFVDPTTGAIKNTGVYPNGVIGEPFTLRADCVHGQPNCENGNMLANPPASAGGTIQYLPGLVQGTPVAVPSCANANPFQQAIGGCDESTVYACGTQNGATVDLTENPVNPHSETGDTGTALQCLTHASAEGAGNGQDQLVTTSFPFQIQAGSNNPLPAPVSNNSVVTTSSSIVTLPIYDSSVGKLSGNQPQVTIVGFLQVFVQYLDGNGHPYVTVMNVAGCGNGTLPASSSSALGTSPVPIRLITPP